jgi:hypothetical protein
MREPDSSHGPYEYLESPVPVQMWPWCVQSVAVPMLQGEPSPGAASAGTSPVPVQMWRRCGQSRLDAAWGEPSPGPDVAFPGPDVAGASPVPAQSWLGRAQHSPRPSEPTDTPRNRMNAGERGAAEQMRTSHWCRCRFRTGTAQHAAGGSPQGMVEREERAGGRSGVRGEERIVNRRKHLCSPGANVAGASPVPVRMWRGRAQSRCGCGGGEPSPGADVGGVSRVASIC